MQDNWYPLIPGLLFLHTAMVLILSYSETSKYYFFRNDYITPTYFFPSVSDRQCLTNQSKVNANTTFKYVERKKKDA